MTNFYMRGIASNLIVLLLMMACFFLPAGTFNYWQAWVFLVVFELSAQSYGVYFLIHDRKLLERRMHLGPTAEKVPAQKIIASLFILGFIGMFLFPTFDHRFGWSPVPAYVSIIGNALIVLSFVMFFFVMKANSYAASTIQVEEGQPVISTGPYAYVRHPMYAGALVLLAGVPLALDSWWGLLLILLFMPVLIWRLIDEENFLHKNLPGYTAYTQKVRYRLLPYVW
jgi:protein-S-isoprenylcysteine O-methyltransferase Ste14